MPKKLQKITKPYSDAHPELPIDPDVVQPGAYKWPPHFQPILILYVFIGGCMGAYARYLVIQALPPASNGWPVATTVVNLLGAFVLGFLLEGLTRLGKDQGAVRAIRLFIGTGFVGAFTTYSTFAVEINSLIAAKNTAEAVWYIATTLVGGIILSGLGIQIAAKHHMHRQEHS